MCAVSNYTGLSSGQFSPFVTQDNYGYLQGSFPGSHGSLLAPRRIQLRLLQEILGRYVLCGRAEQRVL